MKGTSSVVNRRREESREVELAVWWSDQSSRWPLV